MADDALPDDRPERAFPDSGLTKRRLLKAAEWMARHDEPCDERIWAEAYRISQRGKAERTRLMALRMFADRIDPEPRPPAVQVDTGPVTIAWKSSSDTDPAPSRPPFTPPSDGTGRALPASSAIDVLENL